MIKSILDRLSQTSSRNEKVEILNHVKGSQHEHIFLEVAKRAYDPNEVYYIKDVRSIEYEECEDTRIGLEDSFKTLDKLKK